MGKFVITISGVDRKGEILDRVFHLRENTPAVLAACKDIFEEEWSCYEPTNIGVDVFDVEAQYRNFKACDVDLRKVDAVIYRKQQERSETQKAEIELLRQLREKYPEI